MGPSPHNAEWSELLSEVTHQIKNEQDNEYQAESTATARMASIGISPPPKIRMRTMIRIISVIKVFCG